MKKIAILLCLPLLTQCGAVGNLARKAKDSVTAKSRAKKQQEALTAYQKAHEEHLAKTVGIEAVGQIVSVDQECQFVLIRNLKVPGIQPDVGLEVKDSGGKTKFMTCPTMKAGFIIADITAGTPQKGDILVVSKLQPTKPNAIQKYMPGGMKEEDYWKAQSNIKALSDVQAPEGNPAIPDLGASMIPGINTPSINPDAPPLRPEAPIPTQPLIDQP